MITTTRTIIPTRMHDTTSIEAGLAGQRLLRVMTWLSPAFPVGAFSYSHGIEYAVEAGLVGDHATLAGWIGDVVAIGTGRVDAALFRAAHEATATEDEAGLAWTIERGDAMRATREIGQESENQGMAFVKAITGSWPAAGLDRLAALALAMGRPVVSPVAVGAGAAAHGVPLLPALEAYLHAFASNLVSAGVRLVPLGQSDGLRALAALEPRIADAALAALARPHADIGSATPMVDWASARHETQYTRLFRS